MLIPHFVDPEQPQGMAVYLPPEYLDVGTPRWSKFTDVQFGSAGGVEGKVAPEAPRPALRAGKKYEAHVNQVLSEAWSTRGKYLPGPWLKFEPERGKVRVCQPDAILIPDDKSPWIIFEIKHTHTVRAYWQLEYLYRPVVGALPECEKRPIVVEVCRHGDPLMAFPTKVKLFETLEQVRDLDTWDYHLLMLP